MVNLCAVSIRLVGGVISFCRTVTRDGAARENVMRARHNAFFAVALLVLLGVVPLCGNAQAPRFIPMESGLANGGGRADGEMDFIRFFVSLSIADGVRTHMTEGKIRAAVDRAISGTGLMPDPTADPAPSGPVLRVLVEDYGYAVSIHVLFKRTVYWRLPTSDREASAGRSNAYVGSATISPEEAKEYEAFIARLLEPFLIEYAKANPDWVRTPR